jgi:hypothetical protein
LNREVPVTRAPSTAALSLVAWLSVSAGTAPAPQAGESSFLCEGSTFRVRIGQHLTEVLWGCGDPDYATQRIERHKTRHHRSFRDEEEVVTEILVDDFVYDFGFNHKARYLRFENGFLTSIISRWIPGPR